MSTTIDRLADSLVHMHINRVIRSAQRAHELVIYDLLARLYRARQWTAA
ncbi:MAG: lantibiotic dehydratase C-terminal domain-containing protein [Myxococcota bacterium]